MLPSSSHRPSMYFYPLPPRGGRQRQRYDGCAGRNFYPRPPRGGRRTLYHKSSLTMRDFYPRPPRGGRRIASGLAVLGLLFLSTPSARRATQKCSEYAASTCNFYPRPPRGGRPGAHRHSGRYDAISIHALREEGDYASRSLSLSVILFLSTPSARRATSSRKQAAWFRNYFYPRPPRGGRPPLWRSLRASAKISIHALREEGDGFVVDLCVFGFAFLSTPSARRATFAFARSQVHLCGFLSTPSARRATDGRPGIHQVRYISIHALREEGDLIVLSPIKHSCISIHALREEGDSKNRDKISIFKQIIQHSARI